MRISDWSSDVCSSDLRDVLAAARGKKGLRDEISPAMYARVQARARGDGLSDSVCDPYAAWFCAMTLEIFSFTRQGFDAASGLDQYFYALAVNDNKSVAWLEAPTENIRLFTELTPQLGTRFQTGRASCVEKACPYG